MDTPFLTPDQRLYLPLLMELLLESPIGSNDYSKDEEEYVDEYYDEDDESNEIFEFGQTDVFDSYTFNGLDLSTSGFGFGKFFSNVGISFMVHFTTENGVCWVAIARKNLTLLVLSCSRIDPTRTALW